MSRSSSALEIIAKPPPLKIRVLRLQPCPVQPLTYREPMRFETMPSRRMTKDGDPIAGDRLAELDAVAEPLVLRAMRRLFDYLVSPQQDGLRNCDAQRLRDLRVHRHLEACRLLHRQISRLGARTSSASLAPPSIDGTISIRLPAARRWRTKPRGRVRVWNRIPDKVRGELVQLALEEPELSPRELAMRFTDTKSYFVSEASVYRLPKDHDLIASPAYIVIKAADEFKDKTTAPNQLWQTDFTYLKVIGLVADDVPPGSLTERAYRQLEELIVTHVALHGCAQDPKLFAQKSGYNDWAEQLSGDHCLSRDQGS